MKTFLLTLALAGVAAAQSVPDGAGRAEFERMCQGCHELQRATSMHLDRVGWANEVNKMLALGAQGSNADFATVIDYLSAHFPADPLPKIDANKAKAIDFESAFSLRRSQSALIIAYREKNGPFKSLQELEKVPGVEIAKIEKHKDRLVFEQ